jgi:hypothetical protein
MAARSASSAIGSAFMTGSPNRRRTALTRSGLAPMQLEHRARGLDDLPEASVASRESAT